jgi:hypothetical protein
LIRSPDESLEKLSWSLRVLSPNRLSAVSAEIFEFIVMLAMYLYFLVAGISLTSYKSASGQ